MPTFLRLRQGDSFQRGPWHLGRWSKPIGIIAVVWVVIITILFMLPESSPITWTDFNYTIVAVVVVLGFAGIYWLVSARNWFTGPRVQGTRRGTGRHRSASCRVLMPLIRGHGPYSQQRGMLTLEQLRVEVGEGEIDTVVLAFTDMQGRLQGKRLSAEFFLDEVAEHFSEGCNYLLAVDVDMNTVDGYAMSSWETGYGDFVLRPDLDTLRRMPWHPATALVIADLTWLDGSPVAASPRQILQRQVDRLAERGWAALAGTELEFIVYDDTYEAGRGQGLPRPGRRPTSTTWTTRSWAPPGSSRCCAGSATGWPARACTSSRPRASATWASTRSPSGTPRWSRTCDNHSIYKTGAKEIAAQDGMSITFMAKPNAREGNSCHIHLSLRDDEGQPGAGRRRPARAVARSASTSWPASWPRCAS